MFSDITQVCGRSELAHTHGDSCPRAPSELHLCLCPAFAFVERCMFFSHRPSLIASLFPVRRPPHGDAEEGRRCVQERVQHPEHQQGLLRVHPWRLHRKFYHARGPDPGPVRSLNPMRRCRASATHQCSSSSGPIKSPPASARTQATTRVRNPASAGRASSGSSRVGHLRLARVSRFVWLAGVAGY
jgi:hypothetical protein